MLIEGSDSIACSYSCIVLALTEASLPICAISTWLAGSRSRSIIAPVTAISASNNISFAPNVIAFIEAAYFS